MEVNKILNADILDIIFDGKNKSYGAYELRKSYNARLTKALIITASALLLIFLGSVLMNIVNKNDGKNDLDVIDTQMAEIKKDEPMKCYDSVRCSLQKSPKRNSFSYPIIVMQIY